MADEANKPPQVEIIPSVAGEVSAVASAGAPFIYFELAPTYGFVGGIASVTLEATRLHPSGPTGAVRDRVVVAHLRMGIDAVRTLRAALDGILLMATPKPEGPAN